MTRPDIIETQLRSAPIIPLVNDDDPARAVATVRALTGGGLRVIEVLLRNARAFDVLAAIRAEVPDATVGAGTVLTLDQAREASARGAQFVVSPGLYGPIVTYCTNRALPCFPGAATASEVQHAHTLGLRCVKFFPAKLAGGTAMIKTFSDVFADMRFMPTGGIDAANLAEYLAVPNVVACGGSWLTPPDAVERGDFAQIRHLAVEALDLARSVRG